MSPKLKVGELVPDFELFDQNLNRFKLSEETKLKNLVVFFYPKDHTPSCTKEACCFRDNIESFREFETEIIGISTDSINTHQEFSAKNALNFRILSDKEGKAKKLFGVGKLLGLVPSRETYIIAKGGILLKKFSNYFNETKHIEEALDALKQRYSIEDSIKN